MSLLSKNDPCGCAYPRNIKKLKFEKYQFKQMFLDLNVINHFPENAGHFYEYLYLGD